MIKKLGKVFTEDIMKWSEDFYSKIFNKYEINNNNNKLFSLKENDYTFNDKKFGGNAQYITGGKISKFVHHTSFLFEIDFNKMEKYLLLPKKKPNYR